ncbi:hypothetical protein AALO_G00247320 [Alosa alosa]|uniref:Protein kinase domain-containing protein n=1 Tax=Alosa alosa TaxID=278164 RepID=A0AAV6FVT6_9TELE|nr:hypothetical protein AALO_G00247320 [Alosa alosa]
MGHAKYVVETFKNTKLPCMGKYVLLDCLGNNILRAANMDTGKKLICKVFYFARYWESLAAYFQVPAHRNLSQIIDTVHGDTMVYVFFEHNYGDLHSCLRSVKKIREDEAARLFHQMVSAVVHCHDYGVVLKDLKLKSFVFKDEDRSYLKLDTLEDAYLMGNVPIKASQKIQGHQSCNLRGKVDLGERRITFYGNVIPPEASFGKAWFLLRS